MSQSTHFLASQLERITASISKLESSLTAAEFRRFVATQATPVPIPEPPFCATGPSLVSCPLPEPDPPDARPLYDAAMPPYLPNSNWNLPPPNQPSHQVQPRRVTGWDPPGSRNPLNSPAYAHLHYGYDSALDYNPAPYQQQRTPYAYNQPGQQDRVWSYQLHRPSLPPLPIIKPTSCWGPPAQGDPFGPPQFDQYQPLSSPIDRPTCWDPPGQQGYPTYEQPPPFGWPTPPPPTHMEPLDRVFVEFRPQPPMLQRYQGETEEDRCYGDDFIHAHSPQLDKSLDAYGCGYAHELREQKEVDSSPSSLVVQIGYSSAGARDFDCFSERGMVNEMLCDKLEMKLSTYSISETKSETNETIDGDAAYSEIGNRSNPSIGLPSDFSGVERELKDDSSPPSAAISLHVTTPYLASNHHPQVDVPSSRKKEWEKNLLLGLSFVSEVLLKGAQDLSCEKIVGVLVALPQKEVAHSFIKWRKENYFNGKVDLVLPDETNEKSNKTKFEFFFTVGVLALRQLCAILEDLRTFDPGGDTSPKLLVATLFVLLWFPP